MVRFITFFAGLFVRIALTDSEDESYSSKLDIVRDILGTQEDFSCSPLVIYMEGAEIAKIKGGGGLQK